MGLDASRKKTRTHFQYEIQDLILQAPASKNSELATLLWTTVKGVNYREALSKRQRQLIKRLEDMVSYLDQSSHPS